MTEVFCCYTLILTHNVYEQTTPAWPPHLLLLVWPYNKITCSVFPIIFHDALKLLINFLSWKPLSETTLSVSHAIHPSIHIFPAWLELASPNAKVVLSTDEVPDPHPLLDLQNKLGCDIKLIFAHSDPEEQIIKKPMLLAGHLSLHRHRQRGGKEGQVLHRSKRGWVWNQFFVIEEYTGPDPVLVGRVSITHPVLLAKRDWTKSSAQNFTVLISLFSSIQT